jgi:hypothetical protein
LFIGTKTGFVKNFPIYLHSFCGQTACILLLSLKKVISAAVTVDLVYSFNVRYGMMDIANMLYMHGLVYFWTSEGVRT